MASSARPYSWTRGFREPGSGKPWLESAPKGNSLGIAYVPSPSKELVTSSHHNHLGINVLRTWPVLYDGTNSPHDLPEWWKPSEEVDVLICGAGPSGLEVALSLVRQGVSFRIIDQAESPLISGRADGVQPRFLEILNSWGLAEEVHEEGPIIERTAIYKDGHKLFFDRSHQSDSRYRGLHIITQGQIERVYIRDLVRHGVLVERSTTMQHYTIDQNLSHPVAATLQHSKTGQTSRVKAKFLVGADGAASQVRKSLSIPFDGMSTDIYWGIMDCIFESDYPHAWVFGSVISSEHGGCVIIPREDGYVRLYTQLNIALTGPLATSRQAKEGLLAESGGNIDVHTITPNEVLEQANRIFVPYKLKFAAPLSWFAIWKISERVARSFSSPDLRVHLAGDAAHVHSVMGAFGLNASIMDASNLAWKLGLVARGKAKMHELLSTYSSERRDHAVRIIEASGEYLRFVCATDLPIADLRNLNTTTEEIHDTHSSADHVIKDKTRNASVSTSPLETAVEKAMNGHVNGSASTSVQSKEDVVQTSAHRYKEPETKAAVFTRTIDNTQDGKPAEDFGPTTNGRLNGTAASTHQNNSSSRPDQSKDLQFLHSFFSRYGQFLLGVDAPFCPSVITTAVQTTTMDGPRPFQVNHGVRAPNPRICTSRSTTGYLYDQMRGASLFHILIFASSLVPGSTVAHDVSRFSQRALLSPSGFYQRYGGANRFNVVVVVKCLPAEVERCLTGQNDELARLGQLATLVFDDRAPDEDAHTTWGASHLHGGVAVVRPDLWVGMTGFPHEVEAFDAYFGGFLEPVDS